MLSPDRQRELDAHRDQVREELIRRIDSLVRELLPAAVCVRAWWHVGSVRGEAGQSMRISRTTGFWKDENSFGDSGDVFALIQTVNGFTFPEAMEWASQFVQVAPIEPTESTGKRKRKSQKMETTADDARNFWRRCVATPGTPAAVHLRSRGFSDAPHLVRYCPDALEPETNTKMPCIAIPYYDTTAKLSCVQRYFITPDGKRPSLKSGKKVIGPARGAVAKHNTASSVKARLIAEGPTDGMAIGEMFPDLPAYSAVAASHLAEAPVWSQCETVFILCQREQAKTGEIAAELLRQRYARLAPETSVVIVLPPGTVKDWADAMIAPDLGASACRAALKAAYSLP
jgi:hypothetical protein